MEKYVPRELQNAKCAEFEQLKQTGKIIAEYEETFTNLSEYVPYLVATNKMRARIFEDGLRHEIKKVIRPLVLPTYTDVLDRAIMVEQDEMEKRKYYASKRDSIISIMTPKWIEETKARIELEKPRERPKGAGTDVPDMWEESFRRMLEEQD
ncbi:hypothetical protein Acr_18g0008940 [Actinidia rufa]|uniref:Retrotransposon gag domain-containing protein n=1 Tax=Actinidia rufa TaxID=165716 RepID=A0A7J0G7F1_9ERIC|nr:hypothetical protein Acr_18g0008940 [Actinidia rufa]